MVARVPKSQRLFLADEKGWGAVVQRVPWGPTRRLANVSCKEPARRYFRL